MSTHQKKTWKAKVSLKTKKKGGKIDLEALLLKLLIPPAAFTVKVSRAAFMFSVGSDKLLMDPVQLCSHQVDLVAVKRNHKSVFGSL